MITITIHSSIFLRHSSLPLFIIISVILHVSASFAFQAKSNEIIFGSVNFARLKDERVLFHPGLFSSNSHVQFDAYFSRPHGLRELDTRSILVMIPLGGIRFGTSLSSYGGELYQENEVTLMGLNPLVSTVFISSEITYLSVSISGYSRMSDYSLTEGLFLQRSRFSAGIRFLNVLSGGTAHTGIERSRAFQFMAGVGLSPSFEVATALLRETGFPMTWVMENRLNIGGIITFSTGVGANPSNFTFGLEVQRNQVHIVYRLKQNQDLGSTSQVGISFDIGKKQENRP